MGFQQKSSCCVTYILYVGWIIIATLYLGVKIIYLWITRQVVNVALESYSFIFMVRLKNYCIFFFFFLWDVLSLNLIINIILSRYYRKHKKKNVNYLILFTNVSLIIRIYEHDLNICPLKIVQLLNWITIFHQLFVLCKEMLQTS